MTDPRTPTKRYIHETRYNAGMEGRTIPEGCIVVNAPRPLPASDLDGKYLFWQGDFISGIFYSVIREDDTRTLDEAADLDAYQLIPVSDQTIWDWGMEYYRKSYPKIDLAEFDKDELEKFFRTRYFDVMNHGG